MITISGLLLQSMEVICNFGEPEVTVGVGIVDSVAGGDSVLEETAVMENGLSQVLSISCKAVHSALVTLNSQVTFICTQFS